MNTYNGSDYIILIDTVTPITAASGTIDNYRPVLCGTSNGLNLEFESISFRNKCDGGYDRTESGYGTWGFDLDGHAIGIRYADRLTQANFQEVAMLAIKKRKFWAKMSNLTGNIVREGVVRIGSYRETAEMDTPYSFSVSFVGIGEPIFITNLFTTVLSVNNPGTELIQDGNNNLIENNDGY